MAAIISGSRLTGAAGKRGCLGTVALTGTDQRWLLAGANDDPRLKEALKRFPYQDLVREFWEIVKDVPRPWRGFRWEFAQTTGSDTIEACRKNEVLAIIGAWVEVTLAFDIAGEDADIGVNLMWELSQAFLPYLYGALLANAKYIMVGAGIPRNLAGIVTDLCHHCATDRELTVSLVDNAKGLGYLSSYKIQFDPSKYVEGNPPMIELPTVAPIISSNILIRVVSELLQEYDPKKVAVYAELPDNSGGHHMNPRGAGHGEEVVAVYGERDYGGFERLLEELISQKIPLWIGGDFCNPKGLAEARALGAEVVLGGTVFALSSDSGMRNDYRLTALKLIEDDKFKVEIRKDVSPAGLAFSVANVSGTECDMPHACTIGLLLRFYQLPDEGGALGTRCSAEPMVSFESKGGHLQFGRPTFCLCRRLMSTAGFPAIQGGKEDLGIVTLSGGLRNIEFIRDLISKYGYDYTAGNVIDELGLK